MRDIMLSVCVVSYNHEKYIEECLDHLLMQKTNFNVEILVGDDCSTDHTLQIVKDGYADQVTILERSENMGLCRNMYDLFMHAQGKYIYLMNGDDYLHSDETFQKQVDFLEANQEYFSVTARDYIYKPADGSFDKCQIRTGDYTIRDFLVDGLAPCNYGTMRNIFYQDRENNKFLQLGSRNNEEITMWMYTMDQGKKHILPDFMGVYRYVNADSENYNTRYSFLEMFQHYYDDFNVIKPIYEKKYDLRPFKLKLFNRFCLKIGDSPANFMKFMSILSLKDKIEFIVYKVYLKTHHYSDPKSWTTKSCILSER